jgi:hypothetical protein
VPACDEFSSAPPIETARRLRLEDALSFRFEEVSRLQSAVPGGPKLVAVYLATNKIVKRILLPPSVAGPTSYMNDVRFDLRVGSPQGRTE